MEMTKKKEKEIGTLLGVGTAFVPVHTFNKEDYVALFAFKETVKGLEKDLLELEEENKKLKLENADLIGERDGLKMVVERLQKEIEEQEAEGHGLFDEIDYRKREAKRLGWKPNK